MSDIVDLSEHKRAQISVETGSGPRDPMTGSDLDTILEGIDAARANADDVRSDIEKAAGILEVFAIDCSDPHRLLTQDELDRQWHQVEYLAKQLLRHAGDLEDALNGLEGGVFAAQRAAKAAADEEGDAA